jgi:hypothetical protein
MQHLYGSQSSANTNTSATNKPAANTLYKINLFEYSVLRMPNLDVLLTLSALHTIQPASIDNDRVFSVAGNFKTKIRSRMKFRVSNALVFFK